MGLMAGLDGCGKSRPPAVFDARTAQLNHPPPPSTEVKVVSYISTPTHSAYIRTQFLLDGGTVPRSISPEPFFLPGRYRMAEPWKTYGAKINMYLAVTQLISLRLQVSALFLSRHQSLPLQELVTTQLQL